MPKHNQEAQRGLFMTESGIKNDSSIAQEQAHSLAQPTSTMIAPSTIVKDTLTTVAGNKNAQIFIDSMLFNAKSIAESTQEAIRNIGIIDQNFIDADSAGQ